MLMQKDYIDSPFFTGTVFDKSMQYQPLPLGRICFN